MTGVRRIGVILVTGSTGTTGGLLLEKLVNLGAPTRTLVRTPEKATAVEREGVENTPGDFQEFARDHKGVFAGTP